MGYKIIDYAGETIEGEFPNAKAAYVWLSFKFSADYIHEMQMKVIREEEEDEKSES